MSISRSRELRAAAVDTSRDLRRRQTHAEAILWSALRNRALAGRKFLRQYPILVEFHDRETFFVADFYCAAHRLIVEVDGGIHLRQSIPDMDRDRVLQEMGYQILRLKNEEVEHGLEEVLKKICKRVESNSPPVPLSFTRKRGGVRG